MARRRVVLFNADPGQAGLLWLTAEYLPGFLELIDPRYRQPGAWEAELRDILGGAELTQVPIPHDCLDGFYGAFWRRPRAYLDPRVRDGISVFRLLPEDEVATAVARLRADLDSGAWERRYADVLERDELDLGFRVVVADYTA